MNTIDDFLKLSFMDGIIGNVAVYQVLLGQIPEACKWNDEDWNNIRISYYMTVKNPGSAWLHDVYKNRCGYNIKKTYKFLQTLKQATI